MIPAFLKIEVTQVCVISMRKIATVFVVFLLIGCSQEGGKDIPPPTKNQALYELNAASQACSIQARAWGKDNVKHALACKEKANTEICIQHFSEYACNEQ